MQDAAEYIYCKFVHREAKGNWQIMARERAVASRTALDSFGAPTTMPGWKLLLEAVLSVMRAK